MKTSNHLHARPNMYISLTCLISAALVIGVTFLLLLQTTTDTPLKIIFSLLALAWFSIAWSQVGELSDLYRALRRIGQAVTLAALGLSFIVIWTQNPLIFSMLQQPVGVCYIFSYTAAHTAYFLNARPFGGSPLLANLAASAIICTCMVSIFAFMFVVQSTVLTSMVPYHIALAFMMLSALITLIFSMLKPRMIVSV